MSLLKPTLTVGGFTMISRVAGFVRDMCMATILGAGMLMDTFLVAFKLPNFFRHVFAEGAFNASFVPLFSGMVAAEGMEQAKRFAGEVFSLMLVVLLLFTIVMQIAMPWVIVVLAPGFNADAEQLDLAVLLTRITFPYLLFISLVSLLGGILNSVGKFAAAAASPIYLNLTLIASLYGLSRFTETPAHALAMGVAIAGVIQFAMLYHACRKTGINLRLKKPVMNPAIKTLLKRMVPGVIGTGVMQINLWVDMVIATLIPSAVSYLYYADRINQLPLAIIGIAVGTAILPLLSKHLREGKVNEAIAAQNKALEIAAFFTLPATVGLLVLSYPIISVLFEHGAFTAKDSHAAACALSAFATGLPAYILVKLFAPSFFAAGDTKTPVKVAIICLVANIVFNGLFYITLPLLHIMPHIGIALATSLSSWLNITLLAVILHRRKLLALDRCVRQRLMKLMLAALIMAGITWYWNAEFSQYFLGQNLITEITGLTVLITASTSVFLLFAFATRAISVGEISSFLRRRR